MMQVLSVVLLPSYPSLSLSRFLLLLDLLAVKIQGRIQRLET